MRAGSGGGGVGRIGQVDELTLRRQRNVVPSETPNPTEIIARARAMIPTLAQRSLEGRRQRRIPDETIADMQRAGFFRVLQPRRWGGYEMDLSTFYEVQLAFAEGDMSTAWIYGVSGVHPWFMALLDDRAAQEVWRDDTSTLICSSLMPAGKATRGRGRLSPERALEVRELLRPLRLGAARRPGRRRRRRAAGRAHLSAAARALSDSRYLAGRRPAGNRKLGCDRRRRVRAGLSVPAHGRQFRCSRVRDRRSIRRALPLAVRPDFRARHLHRCARRPAGHAPRAPGVRQDPRHAGGRTGGRKIPSYSCSARKRRRPSTR